MNKKYTRDEEQFIVGGAGRPDRESWEEFKRIFHKDILFSSYVKKRQRLNVRKPPGRPKREKEEK